MGISVRLGQRLPCFEAADTQSKRLGFLDAGHYQALDYHSKFPTDDTDYAQLFLPAIPHQKPWVCTRWKTANYANVVESQAAIAPEAPSVPAARVTPDEQPRGAVPPAVEPPTSFTVKESALLKALQDFNDYDYDLDEPQYPRPLPNTQVPLAPPKQTNCCTFVEALVVAAWQSQYPDFRWSQARHRQMMIMSDEDFYSPVTALTEAGLAVGYGNTAARVQPWTVIQGWRRQWRSGHTFILVAHHPATDRVLTLEANSAYRIHGVGFRGIGNLNEVGGKPPGGWWETEGLWTWARIQSVYQFRAMAALSVAECQWSGI